ncbi:alcohol dehydrogenase catalytic domain-containing protein [Dyadobacter psychrotolerans]
MIFQSPGKPLALSKLPIRDPQENQILVKVIACGICRTDLHIVDGELAHPKPDLIPGHEFFGKWCNWEGEFLVRRSIIFAMAKYFVRLCFIWSKGPAIVFSFLSKCKRNQPSQFLFCHSQRLECVSQMRICLLLLRFGSRPGSLPVHPRLHLRRPLFHCKP